MRKIRVAQIGLNTYSHSCEIFTTMKRLSDVFEIVGYVLPENERERLPHKVEFLNGYKELTLEQVLSDPEIEAVTVETDEIYLTKYALMAARAGKHIHMEKPGGMELSDFEELISVMKATGKVFHTGYMYRYNPAVIDLLKKVEDGELGDIISVEAQMSCIHTLEARRWLGGLKGGMMFFLGCHLIDLIYRIQGEPKRVIPFNRSTGVDGVTSEDFGMAVLEYENGVSFAKTSATELGGFQRRQLVVSGTKATVELYPLEQFDGADVLTGVSEHSSTDWFTPDGKTTVRSGGRYDEMLRSFAEMVRGEKTNPYTLDYELGMYKVFLKACSNK